MQTNFTPEQLANPRIAEADKILRSCVHCGFCTATCPTYLLRGDERDSPRGRIYLIKDMFEGAKPASGEVSLHVDRCLSCLSCMTTCPSAVDYMHLVDLARVHVEDTGSRPLKNRMTRALLARIVPYPDRFRLALMAAVLVKPFAGLFSKLGLKELAAMIRMAKFPRTSLPAFRKPKDEQPERRSRVILLNGCAQPVLRPDINAATIRLLERYGYEVIIPKAVGCCGALTLHMGREEDGKAHARRTIEAWTKVINEAPVDAIIISASGCGTTIKDYGHMFAQEPGKLSEQAARISSLAKDITEFLAGVDLGAPEQWSSLRVAYHSACSMQHGQKVIHQPKELLAKAGFAVVDIPEGHICCGSAGTYNLLQPEFAGELRDRKIANIRSTAPDLVATGNIGCITQIQSGTDIPVVHTVELIEWAYGGPAPRGLERFRDRIVIVPEEAEVSRPLARALRADL